MLTVPFFFRLSYKRSLAGIARFGKKSACYRKKIDGRPSGNQKAFLRKFLLTISSVSILEINKMKFLSLNSVLLSLQVIAFEILGVFLKALVIF
jgi:hypothetical protein